MSEQMMRDALITAREVLVLEGYAEDNLAIVRIDEALAQQPAAVVELTDEELEAGRHQVFSTNNPFCPCDSKTFRKAARWAIAAHIAKQSGDAA